MNRKSSKDENGAPVGRASSPLAWGGRLFFSPGRMLYVGPGASADRHAHHAIQVVVAFERPFTLDRGSGAVSCQTAIIAADVAHELRAEPGLMALLYLEPAAPGARALQRRLSSDAAFVVNAEGRLGSVARPELATWSTQVATAWFEEVIALLGVPSPPPVLHSAVRKALAILEGSLEAPPRLDELARASGVSGTRLVHLFRAQVGLPIRRYVLWLRIKRAAEAVVRGASLTEAAYAAGFADGPHLSRTFRAMFGTNPSLVMPFMEFAGSLWAEV